MKRKSLLTMMMLFGLIFTFSLALTVFAAEPPPELLKCCWFVNACGKIGYGSYYNGNCTCCIPGHPEGCFQGIYEGCMHACPPNCNIP